MDLKTLGETIGSRAPDGFHASMLAQHKAKRIAEIEARHAADDARRIRLLRAWGPLYHLTGSPKASDKKATRWRAWAARIIDMVAALKAEDLLDRLDEINTGASETSPSRATKQAVEVYRLAIDASAETVAKAVAGGMCEEGPDSKSPAFREHFAEMLRWRILIVVFAAEWRRFTLADLERELERLGEGSARTTAADPTTGRKSAAANDTTLFVRSISTLNLGTSETKAFNAGTQMRPTAEKIAYDVPMRDTKFGESTGKSSSPQPTVYIVDDDEGVRKSLCWLVETLGVPVKTFDCAVSFLDAYDGACPGCLVVDVSMPGMSGLDLQRELRGRGDEIPIIVLTGYGSVPAVVEALKQGAMEFPEKPFDNKFLLETIKQALALDARRRAERREHALVGERMKRLTSREHEVLRLVVEGLSSKEIAARLWVSFKTVEAHRAKIMSKMKAKSVAQLVRTVVSAECHADG